MSEIVTEEEPQEVTEEEIRCELDLPMWSVISFNRAVKSGLTYSDAADLLAELAKESLTGLCIVTDNAAKGFSRDGED